MLEYYEAYTDYLDQMKQFEELVCHVVKKVKGSLKFEYQGKTLDFTPPWKRISVLEGIKKKASFSVEDMNNRELFKKIKSLGSDFEKEKDRGSMIMEAFELTVEKHLWNPVFVMDFPKEISPLTKEHRTKKDLVERFEPYVAGMELGNAYTELNDPIEQRKRLEEQEKQRQVNEEAHPMDHDFAKAIDVGMPPTGGVGLGVERLVLLLADQHSIRDIILFPTLKPQA
jgi:lysyl-tRNA synthetase class 2